MFVFTLNALSEELNEFLQQNSEGSVPILDETFLHCVCLWFNDLTFVDDQLFTVQKAICFVTISSEYFGLIQEAMT